MIKKFLYYLSHIILAACFLFSCASSATNKEDSIAKPLLHEAVQNGDISLVKKLIDQGADVNQSNDQSVTPVMLAAYLNKKDIVQLLIEKGVNVNYDQKNIRSKNNLLLGNNILKYPEKNKNFFLTFDAGDDNTNLNYILTVLKKYNITATFFITGNFMKKYPADVKRIVADGHIAGNHTFTHAFDYKNEDSFLNELYKTENYFKQITGRELTRIWRAPYLRHLSKPWLLKSARKLGYRHIDVSLYSKDWIPEGERLYLSNEKFIALFKNNIDFTNFNRIDADGANYNKFKREHADYHGIIMLMHSGTYRKKGDDFVYTLEDVIMHIISSGYSFDNCLKFQD